MHERHCLRELRARAALVLALLCALAGCGKTAEEHLAAARSLQSKGESSSAILELKSLLQEKPEHAEARLYLGSLYLETGDYRGAETELRRALDAGMVPDRVMPALAKVLVLQGAPRRALDETSIKGIDDKRAAATVMAAHGLAYQALRQPNEAEDAYRQALGLQADNEEALLGRARLLASAGKLDEALQQTEQALAKAPQSVDALTVQGDLLRALGRVADAKTSYSKAVEVQPGHVSARLALVSLALSAGALDEAARELEAVRKAAPGNVMGYYFQALLQFRKGDFKSARDSIGAVLKVAPNHLPSVLLGGAIEFALGSQELAQARLKHVMERAPGNLYARRILIASYIRSGQTHKAVELLEPVLKQGTKDPAILALAGEVHMQLNEYEKARKYFEQASALAPKNSAMRTGLGLTRLAAGDIEAGTAELESAAALDESRYHADVLLVTTFLQQREFGKALQAVEALEKKQPNNPLTYNLAAAAHLGNKDEASARRALEKALSLQPNYTPAAMNLAQLDLKAGNKAVARKRFEDMIARDRSNVQAYLALASLAPRIDASPTEVQRWLEAARRENPGSVQPMVMLARFHFRSGEPKKALEVMERALTEAPNNPEVLELAGEVQLATGEKNRAVTTFGKWLSVQPQSAQAHYRFATAQAANEDRNGAIASLQKAIALRPEFPEAQVLFAELQARAGRFDEALKSAVQLQRQSPKLPVGWVVEGDVLMAAKKPTEAVQAYQTAFERGKSSDTALRLHSALVQDGRPREAEQLLKDWIRATPGDLKAQLYLGEAYLKSGRYNDAVSVYERMNAAAPGNIVVLNNLAWCYHNLKDGRALETAEKALKLGPENAAVVDTVGWIMVQEQKAAKGLPLLKKAATLAPKSPEIRFHYAQALATVGEKTLAKQELERLLVEFPKFSERDKAMELLTDVRKG